MMGFPTLVLVAGLLVIGTASAMPYGAYKFPSGSRGAAARDGYGGYWGGYPGYYGHYNSHPWNGFNDLYHYGGRGFAALSGGEDNSIYNTERPSYYNSFCNCNGNSRCIIDCESSHSYKFSS